jgi:antitoxin (DNA-binding transcriptional repressor) of toxin-antitoxin stability system
MPRSKGLIDALDPPTSIGFMGVKDIKVHMSSIVHDVAEDDKWVVITWHGKPRAMLIPFSEEDLEDFILANHPEFIRRQEEAIKEIERGEYYNLEEARKLIEE